MGGDKKQGTNKTFEDGRATQSSKSGSQSTEILEAVFALVAARCQARAQGVYGPVLRTYHRMRRAERHLHEPDPHE